MTDRPFERLLGSNDRDSGCEGGFELLDQYVEALRRGEDVTLLFPELLAHIRNCDACREDTEGLLAALDELEQPPPAR
jgi:hypothetical protein